MLLKKNDCYDVEIIDINNEGNGICKVDGFVIFVPMTAIGDVINIKIVKVLKNYAYGIINKIIKESSDRIQVDCPHFNQCGGCSLRHISYNAELRLKQKFVADCFKRIGNIDTDVSEVVSNPNINYYRNKAQYPLAIKDNRAIAGFYAKRSHRVVECNNCYLQPEIFQDILNSILEFINKYSIPVYDELSHSGLLRNFYIRHAEQTGEIMVCLVVTKEHIPNVSDLVEIITRSFPYVVSIIINVNPDKTNVILGEKCKTIYGKNTISDILCGLKFEISPLAFYQINRTQTERLYTIVADYANLSGKEYLLDLYCGTGTIGLSMAKKAKHLIGIEIIPQAIENAKKNAKNNCINNAEFICADSKKAIKELKNRGIKPDVIILDPPRKGCDKIVLDNICIMNPKKIVLISCNPATAARDCRILEENNYKVKAITPVDLFSRTLHVETVVLMSKVET